MDFVSDALSDCRRFRILSIVDQYSRDCIGLVADTSLSGARVARELTKLIDTRSKPNVIVSDNWTEFTSKAILMWAEDRKIRWHYITPGRPMENGYTESFNGSFRDECLNEHWFESIRHARSIIRDWQDDYQVWDIRRQPALLLMPMTLQDLVSACLMIGAMPNLAFLQQHRYSLK